MGDSPKLLQKWAVAIINFNYRKKVINDLVIGVFFYRFCTVLEPKKLVPAPRIYRNITLHIMSIK